ncbi:MAG: hypothetical protein ACFB16_17120 [Phormidesmis sp.]
MISTSVAYAQAAPAQSLSLLPLEPTSFAVDGETLPLDAIASNINNQVATDIAESEEVVGITLEDIPIVRDFVDEEGDMDMTGGGLPVSVGVSSFMDAYGVVVSTDFKVP